MYPPPQGAAGSAPGAAPHYREPPPPPPPPRASGLAALSFAWNALRGQTSTWFTAAIFGFIPVVGPISVQGWHAEVMQRLERRDATPVPPLDFGQLVPLLSRGLPAFLVNLVLGGAIGLLVSVPLACLGGMLSFLAGTSDGDGSGGLLAAFALAGLVVFALMLPVGMAISAATLRAECTEDFSESLKPGALWDFVKRTFTTQLTAGLAFAFLSILVVFAGMLLCFVGIYAVVPLLQLAALHFRWQLYQVYLHRGGTPIPMKQATASHGPHSPHGPHGPPVGYPPGYGPPAR